jgi:hypothetical protein
MYSKRERGFWHEKIGEKRIVLGVLELTYDFPALFRFSFFTRGRSSPAGEASISE